jgi:hypothetical protein
MKFKQIRICKEAVVEYFNRETQKDKKGPH